MKHVIFCIFLLLATPVLGVEHNEKEEVLIVPKLILNTSEASAVKKPRGLFNSLRGSYDSSKDSHHINEEAKPVNVQNVSLIHERYTKLIDAALEKINSLIVTVRTVEVKVPIDVTDQCFLGDDFPIVYEAGDIIEGITVYMSISLIDGPGNTLGMAGPCVVFTGDQGEYWIIGGRVLLDEADLEGKPDSEVLTIILHEILHIVGFGSAWYDSAYDLVQGRLENNPTYRGQRANELYRDAVGLDKDSTISIPVEDQGGSGTRNSHWRTSVFRNEVMTGYLSGTTQQLSNMTAAALMDLGYEVNLDSPAIDTYEFTNIDFRTSSNSNLDPRVSRGFIRNMNQSLVLLCIALAYLYSQEVANL